jgi:hypothetical protein
MTYKNTALVCAFLLPTGRRQENTTGLLTFNDEPKNSQKKFLLSLGRLEDVHQQAF